MRKECSPIDVIEAAYDLALDDQAWLKNLAKAVSPLIEGGHGVYGYYYDVTIRPDRWFDSCVLVGASRDVIKFLKQLVARDDRRMAENIHAHSEALESALQAARRSGFGEATKHGPFVEFLTKTKARDYVAFRTIEAGGKGVAISAAQSRERIIDRRTQRLWSRVAAHVAAARRLREALHGHEVPTEAVLLPNGKIEHAQGAAAPKRARDVLRAAVLHQERARGRLRQRDPAGAIEMWPALVSGRWSLVDRFDREGRRYFVARPNEPGLQDPRALSPRERVIVHLAALGKPIKLVAYELGLGESTISTHLGSALRKLGAKSRVDLVQLAAQLRGK